MFLWISRAKKCNSLLYGGKGEKMEIRKVTYLDQNTELEATVALEEGNQKRPIVFVFHAWGGKNFFAEEKAIELAKMGFIGCALDLYGKGVLGRTREECSTLMQPFILDRQKLLQRIQSYTNLLPHLPEANLTQIGAIGFCFGGLCALDLARSNPKGLKGVVSFHGLLHAPKQIPDRIDAKVLVLHGNNDPMVSREELFHFAEEMEQKDVDWQLHIFGKTMHAFTNKEANDPDFGTVYSKSAEERSFILMQQFFNELFAR